MGARRMTPMAYKAAMMDPTASFLVSKSIPPNRGFYSGTGGGPTTRSVKPFQTPTNKAFSSAPYLAK